MTRWAAVLMASYVFGCAPAIQTQRTELPPVRPYAAPDPEQQATEDRVRAILQGEMQRCWRMPTDLPEPERLVVTLSFELNEDGTLRGQPRVTSPSNYTFDPPMRAAIERAIEAVRACAPYPFPDDPVLGARYDVWREIELRFVTRS